jgi:hypothetical protein
MTLLFFVFVGVADATLWDREGGLIYDDVLDITWLQDANYAYTSGYDSDGLMNWFDAMIWVDGLEYYDSNRNVTWTNWRLPVTDPPTTGSNYPEDYYNQIQSEMGYLFHIALGNNCFYSMGDCTNNNYGPFDNLNGTTWHWSSTESPIDSDWAFAFCFACGYQDYHPKDYDPVQNTYYEFYVLPVMDGDVGTPVPIPPAAWLLGPSLIGLLGFGRKAKK